MRQPRSVMLVIGLTLLTLAAALTLWIFHRAFDRNQNWLDRRVTLQVRRLLEQEIGLKVDTLSVSATQKKVTFKGKAADTKIQLDGDFEISFPTTQTLSIKLNFQGSTETPGIISIPSFEGEALVNLPLSLTRLGELKSFSLSLAAKKAGAPSFGLHLGQLSFRGDWNPSGQASRSSLMTHFEVGVAEWANVIDSSKMARVEKIKASLTGGLSLTEPSLFDGPASLSLQFKSSELLWGDAYLALAGADLPLKAETANVQDGPINLRVGTKQNLWIEAKRQRMTQGNWELRAESPRLEKWTSKLSPFFGKAIESLTRGKAIVSAKLQAQDLAVLSANLEFDDIDLKLPSASTMVKGISGKIEYSPEEVKAKNLAVQSIGVMKLRGSLAPFDLGARRIETADGTGSLWKVQSDQAPRLSLEGIPLELGRIQGTFDPTLLSSSDKPEDESALRLTSSLRIPPTPLVTLTRGACMNSVALPTTAAMALEVPELAIGSDWVELRNGRFTILAFDGLLKIEKMAFYRLSSSVPEVQLSAEFSGFELKRVGEFLGFGRMEGVLDGHLRDLTMQGPLPTQFDFSLRAIPVKDKPNIVFSAQAMKNFVRLFAGEEIDSMPKTFRWLAFGWPSEIFGGYDINYLGIEVFASSGAIMMETMDPPEILAKEGRHYILYGPRFKMPLNTETYPVIVDASSMSRFVAQAKTQIEQIAEAKNKEKEVNSPQDKGKSKEDSENEACLPAELETP